MADAELQLLSRLIAESDASVRFVADDTSFEVLQAALIQAQGSTDRLVRTRHLPVMLMLNFDIRRVVVVDCMDEEGARTALLDRLKAEGTPKPILTTMRFDTFVADWLPFLAAGSNPTGQGVDVLRDFPETLYAIVSTPRAGSTFLAGLLASMGFGRPIEHLRPWMVQLIQNRPPHLFDMVRFLQTFICLGSEDSTFGTKLISHFIGDVMDRFSPVERSYLRELIGRFKIIYLIREEKLDQAISSIRARQTGIWHVTDPAEITALDASDLSANYAEIAWEVDQCIVQETMLADWMAALPACLLITYKELSDKPAAVAEKIGDYFGVTFTSPPASSYIKLSDALTHRMHTGYLAVMEISQPPVIVAADIVSRARRAAAEVHSDLERRGHAIRGGHATSKAGDYQDRHYYLLDYKSTNIAGLTFPCRGPTWADVEAGGHVAFPGAAQTFGAFIHRPFPEQVGQRLGREVLNLGRGGGGPAFFTALPRVMDLVGRCSAVVVQVMAARMSSNSRFESVEGRAAGHYLEADGSRTWMDCEQGWMRALAEGGASLVSQLVEESQADWVAHMHKIAQTARAPTVMFYFSTVKPDHEIGFTDLGAIYGEYPQLVTRAMIEAVRPAFAAYAEIVSSVGLPEPTVSSFCGEPLPVVFGGGTLDEQNVLGVNTYYPSQPMHDQAAEALTQVLRPLLT